jgi:hypothetical protein
LAADLAKCRASRFNANLQEPANTGIPPGIVSRKSRSVSASLNGGCDVAKSIADWMREGEELYASGLKEFQEMEAQLQDLESKLTAKQDEVNQVAQIIGKPLVEGNRRLTAQLVEDHGPLSVPNSSSTIARALSGRNLNR